MNSPIRRFNERGIEQFRTFLAAARKDPSLDPPWNLLDDSAATETIEPNRVLGHPGFTTKRDAGNYLLPVLRANVPGDFMSDAGLWTWLALYYFDDICPSGPSGRVIGADARFIYDPLNGRRGYRHLLATPVSILQAIPDHNRLLLDATLSTHGDLMEQFRGRLYLLRVPSIRALADRLYFDETKGKPKPGISPKKPKRGDLRNRLWIRIQQLQLTYDPASMTADQLLDALGDEFRVWTQ